MDSLSDGNGIQFLINLFNFLLDKNTPCELHCLPKWQNPSVVIVHINQLLWWSLSVAQTDTFSGYHSPESTLLMAVIHRSNAFSNYPSLEPKPEQCVWKFEGREE